MCYKQFIGGGSYGLMGAIAQTIHEGGGKVIGVIPAALKKIERPGRQLWSTPPCLFPPLLLFSFSPLPLFPWPSRFIFQRTTPSPHLQSEHWPRILRQATLFIPGSKLSPAQQPLSPTYDSFLLFYSFIYFFVSDMAALILQTHRNR